MNDKEKSAAIEQARPQPPTLAIFLERTAKELATRTNLLDDAFSEMREIAEKELHARSRTIDSLDSGEISNQRPSPDSGTDGSSATLHSQSQPVAAAAEPAPERTPPQNIQEIAARIHERYNVLNCRGYSTKEWIAALKATEQEIARAVAVPEPADKQDKQDKKPLDPRWENAADLKKPAAQRHECPNCGSTKRSDRSYVDVGIHCTNPWHEETI